MTSRPAGPPLASLRRITSNRPAPVVGERCEMCAEPIGDEHQHVVNLESRGLMCTCRGCYLLFTAETGRAALPRGARPLPVVPRLRPRPRGSGTSWRSRSGWRSCSATRCWTGSSRSTPARPGATESELPLDAWDRIVAANPELGHAAPRRRGAADPRRPDRDASEFTCHLVPIDTCYELVGRLRCCGAASTAGRRPAPRSTSSSRWWRRGAARRRRPARRRP